MTRRMFYVAAIGVLASGLAAPAPAQFDPLHNNLKCYKIKGSSLAVNLQLDNQFGRERVFKLVPQFLCAPTQKTCCAAGTTTTVCQPIPCPPEPSLNQPAAVDHFKCYKIQVKQCTPTAAADFDCSKLIGRFPPVPPAITATLVDQFHTEDVTLSKPKMLCVPVLKIRGTTTTTATTSTTTTTGGCGLENGNPSMCAGFCPPGQTCLFDVAASQCSCSDAPCGGSPPCVGRCPSPEQQCHAPVGSLTCACCFNPGVSCTSGDQCCSGSCNAATLVCD